jgi:hypothetical protein
MKTCIKCGKEKAVSEFYTGRNACKMCRKEYMAKYQKMEAYKASFRKYRKTEKGRAAKRRAQRKQNHKPKSKIKRKLLSRLHCFLRGIDSKLNRETMGCTRAFIRAHYESLFKPGMTWENYGKEWESDQTLPY